jgi:hypothetical protein
MRSTKGKPADARDTAIAQRDRLLDLAYSLGGASGHILYADEPFGRAVDNKAPDVIRGA